MKKSLCIVILIYFSNSISCTDLDSEFDFINYQKEESHENEFVSLKAMITNHEIGNTNSLARIKAAIVNNWKFLTQKKLYFMSSSFTFNEWWKNLTPIKRPNYSWGDIILFKSVVTLTSRCRLRELFKLALLREATDIISMIYAIVKPEQLFQDVLEMDLLPRQNKVQIIEAPNEFDMLTLIAFQLENPIEIAKFLLRYRTADSSIFSKKVIDLCSKTYHDPKLNAYCEFIRQCKINLENFLSK